MVGGFDLRKSSVCLSAPSSSSSIRKASYSINFIHVIHVNFRVLLNLIKIVANNFRKKKTER